MGSAAEHEALVNDLLVALGSIGVPAWPRRAGSGWTPRGQFVKFSVDGEGDITGIVPPGGWRLEVEVKTGNARRSPAQKCFGDMITSKGGIYLLAYDVVKTMAALMFQVELKTRRGG